jgi:hypothetical protein
MSPKMSDPSNRSLSVADVADEFIQSLEGLDVLVLLARAPEREFSIAEVASALRVSERAAHAALAQLIETGLVSVVAPHATFVLTTSDDRCARAATLLLEAFTKRRAELINHIALRANARLKAFAEAYRRKVTGGDE